MPSQKGSHGLGAYFAPGGLPTSRHCDRIGIREVGAKLCEGFLACGRNQRNFRALMLTNVRQVAVGCSRQKYHTSKSANK